MSWEITKVLITLWPLFITIFLIFAAIINGIYIQGIIYFAGILLSILIWFVLGTNSVLIQNNFCKINTLRLLGYNYDIPNLNTVILWYTNAYIFSSMFSTQSFNPYIISILLIGSIVNIFVLNNENCINIEGFLISLFIGAVCGVLWFLVFLKSGNKNLLYLSEYIEKASVCTVPKKQEFKCRTIKRKVPKKN